VLWRRIRDVHESVLRRFGSSSGACVHVTGLYMTRIPFWTAALDTKTALLYRLGPLPTESREFGLFAGECGVLSRIRNLVLLLNSPSINPLASYFNIKPCFW
jgi:hypothetical protein